MKFSNFSELFAERSQSELSEINFILLKKINILRFYKVYKHFLLLNTFQKGKKEKIDREFFKFTLFNTNSRRGVKSGKFKRTLQITYYIILILFKVRNNIRFLV